MEKIFNSYILEQFSKVSIRISCEKTDGQLFYVIQKWDYEEPRNKKYINLNNQELQSLYYTLSEALEYSDDYTDDGMNDELSDVTFKYDVADEYHLLFRYDDDQEFCSFIKCKIGSSRWHKLLSLTQAGVVNLCEHLKSILGTNKIIDNSAPTQLNEAIEHVAINYRDFIVSGRYDMICNNECHDYETVYAYIPIYKSTGDIEEYPFKARHCRTCKAYYIPNETYIELMNIGRPMCQHADILSFKNLRTSGYKNKNQNQQSILNLLGYNVNKNEDLSVGQRRAILVYAIEKQLITLKRTNDFLEYLIRRNENNSKMQDAISKWKSDIEFLTGSKKNSIHVRYLYER